jgi:hypothetical protein
MLSKTKGCVSLRLSKTDYTKVNRLRGPQADTTCVTTVTTKMQRDYKPKPSRSFRFSKQTLKVFSPS